MDEGNEYNCETVAACESFIREESEKDAEARMAVYIPVL